MTEIDKQFIRDLVDTAETIILPTGRESRVCVDALRSDFDVDVPTFPKDLDRVFAGGKWWRRMKATDGPLRVAEGNADIAFSGTDVLRNLRPDMLCRLGYAAIGLRSMGTVCVLGAEENITALRRQIDDFSGEPLVATTKLPWLLARCAAEQQINLVVSPYSISGSEEASVGWLAPATVAFVDTGASAAAHSAGIVRPLEAVYAAVMWRQAAPEATYE